ncbi:MAG: hypothetical protein HKN00_14305, partial [Flavobacteriaceae bacterium]|nr:hypothetical protein [Flavobacteriaceae bacterium]
MRTTSPSLPETVSNPSMFYLEKKPNYLLRISILLIFSLLVNSAFAVLPSPSKGFEDQNLFNHLMLSLDDNDYYVKSATEVFGGGDYSIVFAASAPFSYDHTVGGGAWNDLTIGTGASPGDDVVKSLQGGQFACGDIVTYLVGVTVVGDETDDPQTIEMDFSFLAATTGQDGAAHIDVTDVFVNYG